jgi:hypothetical protein
MSTKSRLTVLSLIFFLSFFKYSTAQTPVVSKTLPATPAIQTQIDDLKKMMQDISADIRAKTIKEKVKSTSDNPEVVADASLYTDNKGVARAYFVSAGDGDMVISTNYFYDEAGKLRTVTNHFGHISMGKQDQTIFLSTQGRVLRVYVEEKLDMTGEDETFNNDKTSLVKRESTTPEEMPFGNGAVSFVWNPKQAFAAN